MMSRRMSIFAAAAAVVTFVTGGAAVAQDALAKIESSKVIRIAVPTDYPPYGFVGIDLQPQGLDIDTAKLIAEKLGVTLEMVPVTSANRIPYVQTGQVDLVISTLGKNPERAKVIDFTHAYSPFFQAVYGPKSLEIKSYADLGGKTIAVAKGQDALRAKVNDIILAAKADGTLNGFSEKWLGQPIKGDLPLSE
jgi:polar amino acid transport system substrate-binding protein